MTRDQVAFNQAKMAVLVSQKEYRKACILRDWMRRSGVEPKPIIEEVTPEHQRELDAIGEIYERLKQQGFFDK